MAEPLTYEAFRKAHPAIRCLHVYTSETRANHAASFRLGHRQREAMGEYYYAHPMIEMRAFPTAKAATTRAYQIYLAEHSPMLGHNGGPPLDDASRSPAVGS